TPALGGAGRRARSVTRFARDRNFDLYLAGFPVKGFFERHRHIVPQIGATARLGPPAATEGAAKDGLEDIAQVAEIGARMPAHPAVERGVAEAIVSGALLRVLEAFVGGTDRFESGLVLLAPLVAVGVALHRQLAIGGLDR